MATPNRQAAATDLAILVAVVASFWSLRFLGLQFVGIITMAAGIAAVFMLLRWRGQRLADIGWVSKFRGRALVSRTFEAMGVIGITMLGAGLVAGAIFGAPAQSSVLSEQPEAFWFFLLDATLLTWVFIAFGEELVFRGMLLSRLEILFGLQGRANILAASLAQGVLFGIGHASQGVTGMIMTGAIGTALAVYFVTRGQRSLMPLVLAHGAIDTIVLTGNWIARL